MTVSMVIGVFVKIFFLLTPFFVLSVYVTLTRGEEHMTRRKLAVRTTVAVLVIVMILYLFGEAIFRYLGITLDAFRIGSGIVLLLSGIEVVRGTGIPAGPPVERRRGYRGGSAGDPVHGRPRHGRYAAADGGRRPVNRGEDHRDSRHHFRGRRTGAAFVLFGYA